MVSLSRFAFKIIWDNQLQAQYQKRKIQLSGTEQNRKG